MQLFSRRKKTYSLSGQGPSQDWGIPPAPTNVLNITSTQWDEVRQDTHCVPCPQNFLRIFHSFPSSDIKMEALRKQGTCPESSGCLVLASRIGSWPCAREPGSQLPRGLWWQQAVALSRYVTLHNGGQVITAQSLPSLCIIGRKMNSNVTRYNKRKYS